MRVFDRISVDSLPKLRSTLQSVLMPFASPESCRLFKRTERKSTHYSILGFEGSRGKIQLRIGHPGANVDLSFSIAVERSLFRVCITSVFKNLQGHVGLPSTCK
jgi:hypothetical protein